MNGSLPNIKPIGPRDRHIMKHIRALSDAGDDPVRFVEALKAFREDAKLSVAQREAVFKTLAQEAVLAYYAMATGAPLQVQSLLANMPRASASDSGSRETEGSSSGNPGG